MSRRFQFSLKWLFVAMLVVAAFFGGMATQRYLDKRKASAEAVGAVDIVVGIHARDLEDYMGEIGDKLKVPAEQKQEQ